MLPWHVSHLILYQIPALAAAWLFFAAVEKSVRWDRWCAPLLLAAGGLLQMWLWRDSRPTLENPDSLGFFRLSQGLETDLRSILFRPKAYPWFLGLFPSLKAATFAQCLLKIAMGVFLLRFSALLSWRSRTRHLALFLFLFSSLWLREPLRILDSTWFTFLFTGFLWLVAETMASFTVPRFTALCLAGGLVTLTRQAGDVSLACCGALVLILSLRAWLPEYRASISVKSVKSVLSVLAAMALGLAVGCSGAILNGADHGVYRRSISLGVNLYTHSSYYDLADPGSPEWDFVSRLLPGERERIGPWIAGYRHDIPWPVNALPHRLERAMGSGNAGEIEAADKELANRFFHWAGENPGRYARSVLNETARLFLKSEEQYPESMLARFVPVPDPVIRLERGLIHQAPWLLAVLAAIGLALEKKRRRQLVPVAVGVSAYLLVIPFIQLGFTRYSLPALPCLLVLACHATDRLPGPRSLIAAMLRVTAMLRAARAPFG